MGFCVGACEPPNKHSDPPESHKQPSNGPAAAGGGGVRKNANTGAAGCTAWRITAVLKVHYGAFGPMRAVPVLLGGNVVRRHVVD